MAYQGISPYLYRNNLTNVQLLDDISGSFNGTTTQFNLTTNGSPFHAVSARSLVIVLGGIIQEPDADYTVNAGVITFTTAPAAGLTFSARNIYGLNRLTGVNDGIITPASLSVGGPEWDTSGNTTIDGNITQTGTTNNVYINTDTPTVRPTLDLNFERDQRLDSRITFSRDSTATYLGSDGLIKTALAGEPRFEFDTNGNCLGLLIEESRTNLARKSGELSNTIYWTQNFNVSAATAPSITAPDGSTDTWKLVVANNTTQQRFALNGNQGTFTANTYTWSIFAKAAEYSYLGISLYDGTYYRATFNLSNGTTSNISNATASITSYPNGWYRCSITATTAANLRNTVNYADAFWPLATDTSAGATQTGDGTSGVYVWGPQLEVGSFPTSYVTTGDSASTVTRAADNASITGTNFTDFYNNTEFSLYTEVTALARTSYDKRIVNITGTSKRQLDFWLDEFFNVYNFDNTIPFIGANLLAGSITAGVEHKAAVAIKNSDLFITQNTNDTDASSTNVQMFTDVNTMHIGSLDSNGNYSLNGHIKRLTYYPERLSNTQLQNLTK